VASHLIHAASQACASCSFIYGVSDALRRQNMLEYNIVNRHNPCRRRPRNGVHAFFVAKTRRESQ